MIALAVWFMVLVVIAKMTSGWMRGVIVTLYVLVSVAALL